MAQQDHRDAESEGRNNELVRLKVDVIVTPTDEAIAAVKRQTQTTPIVMTELCSANTPSGHCGRQRVLVMQATQQRSGAHHEALADPMAGQLSRRLRDR